MSENNFNMQSVDLPVLVLRGLVGFPGVQVNVEILRSISLKAFTRSATEENANILLLTQRDVSQEEISAEDIYKIGVLAKIKHVVKNTQNHISVTLEGICRFRAEHIELVEEGYFRATGECLAENHNVVLSPALTALMREVEGRMKSMPDIHPTISEEIIAGALAITDPLYYADFVASAALLDYKNKQAVLGTLTPSARLKKLLTALAEEALLLECEQRIQMEVREKIDQSQKNFFLREQLKAIQNELGEESDDEIDEYERQINAANLPEDVHAKLMKELGKLEKSPYGSAEATVIRGYLDTCLEFPFGKKTDAVATVATASRILEEDHDGLDKVKERILEFVAVKQFAPEVKNQILCLVGPPGTGKTSVAASIARAQGRKYARVSLGGMHDEAEIRGHRKTYVGAMPGRIVNALITAQVTNPVIVLDEIDKMASNFRGDPTSALLEVLDPEQNRQFRDNFMELPIDLSECMFIATANSYEGIPLPLLDRMEIIELSTYTDAEKLSIVKNHILPKQLRRHGMNKRKFRITDGAILALIRGYTKEAGVRNLEQKIASLIRKSAKRMAENEALRSVTVKEESLVSFLGKVKYLPELPEETDPVGIVNGLAYTQTGGDLLKVEVAVMNGSGKIELTGSLGEVMKESARIAHSYVRTLSDEYKIDRNFYKEKDLHIHFPEGAVPKDGPSAGVTMVTAIVSALSGTPVKRDVAMTGEVTLRGKVLPIGGLREKTLAAYRAGIKKVILPEENMRDLDEIDPVAREALTFLPCKTVDEVLLHALSQ